MRLGYTLQRGICLRANDSAGTVSLCIGEAALSACSSKLFSQAVLPLRNTHGADTGMSQFPSIQTRMPMIESSQYTHPVSQSGQDHTEVKYLM